MFLGEEMVLEENVPWGVEGAKGGEGSGA